MTDEPTPEVAATGHQRTIITIQEQYLADWLTPATLSKDRLDYIHYQKKDDQLRSFRGAFLMMSACHDGDENS